MDPTVTLEEILVHANKLNESDDPDAARLAELVLALHVWISQGGFYPKQWQLSPHKHVIFPLKISSF